MKIINSLDHLSRDCLRDALLKDHYVLTVGSERKVIYAVNVLEYVRSDLDVMIALYLDGCALAHGRDWTRYLDDVWDGACDLGHDFADVKVLFAYLMSTPDGIQQLMAVLDAVKNREDYLESLLSANSVHWIAIGGCRRA